MTRVLADYVVRSSLSDAPAGVRHEATRSFFNWLACGVGGCRHDAVVRACAALSACAGQGHASIIGTSKRVDPLTATLINGISGHVMDFDDAQPRNTNINPSCSVAPAVLAVSEHIRVSGADALHAFLLGLEVECRIANAVYARGSKRWFANSTTGVFGAAAAAGKLLALNSQQMAWALGMAAAQASGLRVVFGTMSKSFIVGQAAQNGIKAAMLAQSGFTSSERSLEEPMGFAATFGLAENAEAIVENLGLQYEVSYNTYKPYACGIVLHAAIDACIRVRNEHKVVYREIDSVDLQVNPAVVEVTGNLAPSSGLEGKFSVTHAAAVALIDGAAGERQFFDERVNAADVVDLRQRIRPLAVATLARHQAHVKVVFKGGGSVACHVEHALGSLGNPLTDGNLETKLRQLADGILPHATTERLIRSCWDIEDLEDMRILTGLLAQAGERQ